MIITPLLQLASEKKASDLFFSVGAPVNIKIDGIAMPVNSQLLDAEMIKRIAYEMMTPKQIAEFEAKMEMNFSFRYDGIGNFRVNIFRQRNDIAIVVRHVRGKIENVEDLHLPSVLKELIMEKRGLVLVVGATGSGKSTTLASMLEYRNSIKSGHILTIEDPIEYIFKHNKSIVNQREIGTDTLNYESALASGMREAPDVLMIGEVRDRETLKHALIFAQTGHLCLTTLHANNSYHALNRIVNFFPYDSRQSVLSDLSMCLRAVISQRLIRNVNGKQVPAVEVLLNTALIADMIKNDEIDKIREAIEKSVSPGSQTFEQALYKLLKAGQITKEEAMRNADSASNLASLVDFSERTSTMQIPAYKPEQDAQPKPAADFGGIKLNLDETK
ncbi:MAG: type IV pili twitching motility protein PilT [Gallionellales bacterium GWA2_60_142]|jgi:twitching motility protein PilU|nr:MAG: type IV pili twitching motility protein PilT [Gallionellales bacterium GWA2_60_142]HCI13973.1 type IV pili twitching motility protein PilT [Gallionellaceae bacterium]